MSVKFEMPATFQLRPDSDGKIPLPMPTFESKENWLLVDIISEVEGIPPANAELTRALEGSYASACTVVKQKLGGKPRIVRDGPLPISPLQGVSLPQTEARVRVRLTLVSCQRSADGNVDIESLVPETTECIVVAGKPTAAAAKPKAPAAAAAPGAGAGSKTAPAAASSSTPQPGAATGDSATQLVVVEPVSLDVALSDTSGKLGVLRVRLEGFPDSAVPTMSIADSFRVPLRTILTPAVSRPFFRESSQTGKTVWRVDLELAHSSEVNQLLGEIGKDNRPLIVPLRTYVGNSLVQHQLVLKATKQYFEGWLAIDLGTTNCAVAIYDQGIVVREPVLPQELAARLREQLIDFARNWMAEKSFPGPRAKFLEHVLDYLGIYIKTEAPRKVLEDHFRHVNATELPHIVRLLENAATIADDGGFRRLVHRRLQKINEEVYRTPCLEADNVFMVKLDVATDTTTIPSAGEILSVTPLAVQLGKTAVDRSRDAQAHERWRYFEAIKLSFGQDRKRLGLANQLISVDDLMEKSWGYLLEHVRQHYKPLKGGSLGELRRVIFTYPCMMLPATRANMQRRFQEGLRVPLPVMDYDEASAAAIFYIYRELGSDPGLGLEALRTRCVLDPKNHDKWFANILVFDIGGGSTDVALLRLECQRKDMFRLGEDPGANAGYYVLTPTLLGSTGFRTVGGNLITMRVFYLLRALIADRALTAQVNGHMASPALKERLDSLKDVHSETKAYREGIIVKNFLSACDTGNADKIEHANKTAAAVIWTRWAEQKCDPESFYKLWDWAEEIKITLGSKKPKLQVQQDDVFATSLDDKKSDQQFELAGKDVRKFLADNLEMDALEGPDELFRVVITREDFERVVRPIVKDAVSSALLMVKDRLENKHAADAGEASQLHWLILSGQGCRMDLVMRELRAGLNHTGDFAWNEELVTFVPEYAKIATPAGAAIAERLRQLTLDDEAVKRELRRGNPNYRFLIDNMFSNLPCYFDQQVQNDFTQLFTPSDALVRLDDTGKGKVRTAPSAGLQPTVSIFRRDSTDENQERSLKRTFWTGFRVQEDLGMKALPADEFYKTAANYKVIWEVDHQLAIRLFVIHGDPHYSIGGEAETLENWKKYLGFELSRLAEATPGRTEPPKSAAVPAAKPVVTEPVPAQAEPAQPEAVPVARLVTEPGPAKAEPAKPEKPTPSLPFGLYLDVEMNRNDPKEILAPNTPMDKVFRFATGGTARGVFSAQFDEHEFSKEEHILRIYVSFPSRSSQGESALEAKDYKLLATVRRPQLTGPADEDQTIGFRRVFCLAIDELGGMRLIEGEPPYYMVEDAAEFREEPGSVFAITPRPQDSADDTDFDPFNGKH